MQYLYCALAQTIIVILYVYRCKIADDAFENYVNHNAVYLCTTFPFKCPPSSNSKNKITSVIPDLQVLDTLKGSLQDPGAVALVIFIYLSIY